MDKVDSFSGVERLVDLVYHRVHEVFEDRLKFLYVGWRQELRKSGSPHLVQFVPDGSKRHFHIAKHTCRPPEFVDLMANGGVESTHKVQVGVVDVQLVWVDSNDGP